MKLTIEEARVAETELVLRCSDSSDPEVIRLAELIAGIGSRITIRQADETAVLLSRDVLYCEYVNRTVFVYTAETVYPYGGASLAQMELEFPDFFRCAKSTVVNIAQIKHLKSEFSGRILATLANGEQLLISRHYASALRKRLKQGSGGMTL